MDPSRHYMRERFSVSIGSSPQRICIPFALLERRGKHGFRFGPVLPMHVAVWDARRRAYLDAHGPDDDIDLAHLSGVSFGLDDWKVRQVRSGWALPASWGSGFKSNPWSVKIRGLKNKNDRALAINDITISRVLMGDPMGDQQVERRTLFVPIDLSRKLASQFTRAEARAQAMRTHLYRYTRGGAPKPRPENVWRDIYIFLLRETTRQTAAEIAHEVFPAEHLDSAISKVRQAVRRVRQAVRVAGLTLPPH